MIDVVYILGSGIAYEITAGCRRTCIKAAGHNVVHMIDAAMADDSGTNIRCSGTLCQPHSFPPNQGQTHRTASSVSTP